MSCPPTPASVSGTAGEGRQPIAVSVVVIAKNEAANIRRCLESVAGAADVLVVDDFSDDETASIAASCGARVLRHRFSSFAAQRNWALEHGEPRHEWVLMLDADEALTPTALAAIAAAIGSAEGSVAAFVMCRRNWFCGRFLRHVDGYPVWIMRLVHRDRARFVDAGHGEVPVPPLPGDIRKIREPFLHFPFSHGLSQWVERHNVYSTNEAQLEWAERGVWSWREVFGRDAPARRRSLRNLARHMPFRPVLRFCYHYFWKWGLLDGRAGLAFSLLMAGYEGLIVLKRRERELAAGRAEPPSR